MESITASMYSMARELIHKLRPRVLDDLGLRLALEAPDIVSQVVGQGMDYQINAVFDEQALSDDMTIGIYRLVQECVHNSVKHSQAESIWVDLTQEGEELNLSVRDDGIGIAPETASTGLGLVTIRDRVIALGGRYELNTGQHGTLHKATFPLFRL